MTYFWEMKSNWTWMQLSHSHFQVQIVFCSSSMDNYMPGFTVSVAWTKRFHRKYSAWLSFPTPLQSEFCCVIGISSNNTINWCFWIILACPCLVGNHVKINCRMTSAKVPFMNKNAQDDVHLHLCSSRFAKFFSLCVSMSLQFARYGYAMPDYVWPWTLQKVTSHVKVCCGTSMNANCMDVYLHNMAKRNCNVKVFAKCKKKFRTLLFSVSCLKLSRT
jgi:hypothetical protein